MKAAPILENEAMRLKELLSYQLLDTAPEGEYDDITKIASEICDTPIALVTLVDNDRQWFKSKQGIDVDQTPRDVSFCGHAIHGQEVFVIEDALKDVRFADNPLVVGAPSVRFYAGAPLVTPSGYGIGTLCVIDHVPRKLNERQIEVLAALARTIVRSFELRKTQIENKKFVEEVKVASQALLESQQQMVYSAKMASLGEMAAGVAHEINNPLAIITGKCDSLLSKFSEGIVDRNEIETALLKMRNSGVRAAKIIKSLRYFAGDAEKVPFEDHKFKDIFEDVSSFFTEKAQKSNISILVKGDIDFNLNCNRIQIEQVLLNLILNAMDAVEGARNPEIIVSTKIEGSKVSIRIQDNGIGISSAAAGKIMTPFFTTKPVGKGVGLGLSISKGIVEAHGGDLVVESLSSPTVFLITLPKSD